MQNILLAINAAKPSRSALDFACYIAGLTNSPLTAIFLENLVAEEKMGVGERHATNYFNWQVEENSPAYQHKSKLMQEHINQFRNQCNSEGIQGNVHLDKWVPAEDIINESEHADVLIVDADTSFKKHQEAPLAGFIKEILDKSRCPVIIAPSDFDTVEEIIFTYDGSKSAAFAIKQFIHLLPELHKKKLIVVQVEETKGLRSGTKHIEELLKEHYVNFRFEYLQGAPDAVLPGYLQNKKNAFFVLGAYGREVLAGLFEKNLAESLSKNLKSPIFLAHY
ncbi:MAG: universal stress protein [Bacteroidetes bacterium]|nr:universal stress protein [Bacteroidota bacterium]